MVTFNHKETEGFTGWRPVRLRMTLSLSVLSTIFFEWYRFAPGLVRGLPILRPIPVRDELLRRVGKDKYAVY